jgi:tetratricopeptide (TPR) repeat protein
MKLNLSNRSINIKRAFKISGQGRFIGEEEILQAETKREAFGISTEADINNLGYQYLGANQVDKAIETFKKNVKDYPESWNVYDSLGEGYAAKGETKLALENYARDGKMVQTKPGSPGY